MPSESVMPAAAPVVPSKSVHRNGLLVDQRLSKARLKVYRRITAFALATMAFPALQAQTITVDLGRDDFTDFGGGQTFVDLPGPDGHITLREAVLAANNTPGPQTIAFAIPTSEWSIFFTDRAIIRLENMLMVSGDDTTIDFSTQADFTGDTNPAGNEVGLMYAGPPAGIPSLWIDADHCTIRGLDIGFGNNFSNTIWITGNHNRVLGCTTNGLMIRGDYGGGAFNTIGGTEPGDGNTFAEWVDVLSNADNNILIGNYLKWGLRISGDTFWGTCDNTRVGGPSVAERNTLSGKGSYGEEGFPQGAQLEVYHAVGTRIEGNFIGTSLDGMSPVAGNSGTLGVGVGLGAVDTTIQGNVISGLVMVGRNHYQGQRFGTGIAVFGSARNTTITGNLIGLAADGATPLPSVQGMIVQSDPNGIPQNVRFGGTGPEEPNEVAFHETFAIRVANSASGVHLSRNSIHDNGGLGIDLVGLAPAGVTPNDVLDADTGGNGLQNYPVLSLVTSAGGTTRIQGTLNSTASATFGIEFFASPSCDPSGFGEGAEWIGETLVSTDSAGNASFDLALPIATDSSAVITATATSAAGSTSEFSACAAVTGAGTLGDLNCDGLVSVADIGPFVLALTDAAAYVVQFPNCDLMNGDLNSDGQVTVSDIGPFVQMLTGG